MEERGSGDNIKKEDELDFIGGFKLYERLRQMYKYTNNTGHIIAFYNDVDLITVPLFVDEGGTIFNISYYINSGHLSILSRWYTGAKKIFMKLSKKYHLYHPNVSIYNIEPSLGKGDVTNSFFIEVIDFILGCVELPYKKAIERNDPIKESVWSDMEARGTGDAIKKEDNVDNLDFNDFMKYLRNRYEVLEQPDFFAIGPMGVGKISIPIERNRHDETPNFSNRMLRVEKDLDDDKYTGIMPNEYVFKLYPRELEKTFGDKYNLDHSAYTITPKDGEITNTVVVDVIDKLINMVDYPILRKK